MYAVRTAHAVNVLSMTGIEDTASSPDTVPIGVDIGGTTMSAGAVGNASIVTLETVETGRLRPADEIVADLTVLIQRVARRRRIGSIGIGVPTPAGPETDTIIPATNLPTMDHYPLRARLAGTFGVPVVLENDANCMTVGEYHAGALRNVRSGVCLTLGTGLGCGVMIDGKLVRGARYFAGEIWNLPVDDGVLLEDIVSIEALKCLSGACMGRRIEPRELFERYCAGEPEARDAWRQYGQAVGRVVAMVLAFLDPERVVIGGGIAGAFEAFRESMIEVIEPVYGAGAAAVVRKAQLSEHAAVLGAGLLAKDFTGQYN